MSYISCILKLSLENSTKEILSAIESTAFEHHPKHSFNHLNSGGITLEIPGYHSTIFQEYNKLLEKTEDYDKCIEVYDTYIYILEKAINDLLDERHKEIIDIYRNNTSDKLRISKAMQKGYSQANFYKLLNESLDIIALAIAPTKEKIRRILE